jgi:predicted dehydrogenase
VTVGMAGAGWAGAMHARSYRKVYGLDCRLKTVCALEDNLEEFARRHGFEAATDQFDDLLRDAEIDIIDVTTPPSLHADMVSRALRAGKNVICEKPLTGFFADRNGDNPDKPKRMLDAVMEEAGAIGHILAESGRRLCYAENWLYSPPFVRMLDLLAVKRTQVILIEGATGHNGSHAPHANYWKFNGGGALIRQGIHPVAAALHLKRRARETIGLEYAVAGVWCDCARLTDTLPDKLHFAARPVDVEDWARVVITFSDGTKADIMAGDVLMGGIVNQLAVHGNDASYYCNMTPNNLLEAYYPDADGFDDIQITEKASHNAGWMSPLVAQECLRGYEGQLQDFLEAVAADREPVSGFALARETLAVIYAAYVSAETGRPIDLRGML